MKFVCDRCQTRYSIADEKVRQKILRIRCKTCGHVIVVQDEHAKVLGGEAGAHSAEASDPFESAKTDAKSSPKTVPTSVPKAAPSSRPNPAPSSAPKATPSGSPRPAPLSAPKAAPSSAPLPSSSPKAAPASFSKTGSASPYRAPLSSGLKVASAAPKAGPGGPPPPPPAAAVEHDPLGGRVEWYLAVGGVRSGPFSRVEAAHKILTAEPGKTVHVWKEGMPGWKPSEEVSVIARELSILRPPPPPPPPPVKTPVPVASSHPKVAAMPPAVAKAAKAQEPQSLFPGRPLTPAPASPSDSMDVAVDTHPGLFADTTTKKAKKLPELDSEPALGVFADVTTKKNRNISELEAGSLFSTEPALSQSHKTPAPVQPQPQQPSLAAKAAEPAHALSSSASLPAPARVSSTNLPVAVLPRPFKVPAPAPVGPFTAPVEPLVAAMASKAAPAVATAPADMGGFSEVILAVAESDQPADAQAAIADPLMLPVFSTFPSPISSELQPPKGLARPGLKYLVAVCAIVALVFLIVMVTLRMDSRKVAEPDPVPAPAAEPVADEPSKAVAVESPKPIQVVDEKPTQGSHGSGKHGSGKSARHMDVGPTPERTSVPKTQAQTELEARPNPFNEPKATVSQSQISAVVRNKVNQAGLKSCYERALKMDNHLTSGRIDVTVSVGMSGMVQRVVINAPSSFILVEPCIKSAVKRWVFPPSSEEYGTNFPLIMQGGM